MKNITRYTLLISALVFIFNWADAKGLKIGKKNTPTAITKSASSNQRQTKRAMLFESEWIVVKVNNTDITIDKDQEAPKLQFEIANSSVYGNDGCNVLNGKFVLGSNNSIRFSNIITTRKFCPNITFDKDIQNALLKVTNYTITITNNINTLFLSDNNDNVLITLVWSEDIASENNGNGLNANSKKINTKILNGEWTIVSAKGKSIKAADGDKTPILIFNTQSNLVNGNNGCNSISGVYSLDETGAMKFGNLASSMIMCQEITYDRDILDAINSTTYLKIISHNELQLTDNANTDLLKLIRVVDSKKKDKSNSTNIAIVPKKQISSEPNKELSATMNNLLLAGNWDIERINNKKIKVAKGNKQPMIHFDTENSRIWGNDGCNTLNGDYEILSMSEIRFSNLAITRMLCPDIAYDRSIVNALNNANTFKIETKGNNRIISILNDKGNTILRLAPSKRSLQNTEEIETSGDAKKSLPIEPTYSNNKTSKELNGEWVIVGIKDKKIIGKGVNTAFLTFDSKTNRVYGNNACNIINGNYIMNGSNSIQFGDLISTMRSCPEVPYDKEIMSGLENATSYRLEARADGRYLIISDAHSKILLTLTTRKVNMLNGLWKITRINGENVSNPNVRIVLDIDGKRMHTRGWCNTINGIIEPDTDAQYGIQFYDIVSTRTSCPDLAEETNFTVCLEDVTKFSKISEDEIALGNNTTKEIVLLKKVR